MLHVKHLNGHNISYDDNDKTIAVDDNGQGNGILLDSEESIDFLKFCVNIYNKKSINYIDIDIDKIWDKEDHTL